MKIHNKEGSGFKEGASAAVPLIIGFIPIAMTFGILAKTMGISMRDCFLFSALVFAGASQFMALNLLAVGAGMSEIILTTLLVNFRHFLMSASLAAKMKEDIKKWIPLIAFCVTDESFSVTSFKEGRVSKEFMLTLQFLSYAAWVGGTVLGYLVGSILPAALRMSMGVGLYAMFIAILVPQAKKSVEAVVLALLSGGINAFLSYFKVLPSGWSIIASICIVSFIGLYIFKEEGVKVYE